MKTFFTIFCFLALVASMQLFSHQVYGENSKLELEEWNPKYVFSYAGVYKLDADDGPEAAEVKIIAYGDDVSSIRFLIITIMVEDVMCKPKVSVYEDIKITDAACKIGDEQMSFKISKVESNKKKKSNSVILLGGKQFLKQP